MLNSYSINPWIPCIVMLRVVGIAGQIPSRMPYVPDYGLGAAGHPDGEARYVVGQRVFINDRPGNGDWEVRTLAGTHKVKSDKVSASLYEISEVSPYGFTDGASEQARFWKPQGLSLHESTSRLAIADTNNNAIRIADVSSGEVTTVAINARFDRLKLPSGVSFDASGSYLLIADTYNHAIKNLTIQSGALDLIAGGVQGLSDAKQSKAMFSYPADVAITHQSYTLLGGTRVEAGVIFVCDTGNHRIRLISPVEHVVSTHAGSIAGHKDAFGQMARFHSPVGMALHHPTGDLYVADSNNHKIRKVTIAGVVSTVAGSSIGDYDSSNSLASRLNFPYGVTVGAVSSSPSVYFTDYGNSRVKVLHQTSTTGPSVFPGSPDSNGQYRTATVCGSVPGWLDGQGNWSRLQLPTGVTLASDGKLYVADTANNALRTVLPIQTALCRENAGSCSATRECLDSRGALCSFEQERCLDTDFCRCNLLYHNSQCVPLPSYSFVNEE